MSLLTFSHGIGIDYAVWNCLVVTIWQFTVPCKFESGVLQLSLLDFLSRYSILLSVLDMLNEEPAMRAH